MSFYSLKSIGKYKNSLLAFFFSFYFFLSAFRSARRCFQQDWAARLGLANLSPFGAGPIRARCPHAGRCRRDRRHPEPKRRAFPELPFVLPALNEFCSVPRLRGPGAVTQPFRLPSCPFPRDGRDGGAGSFLCSRAAIPEHEAP